MTNEIADNELKVVKIKLVDDYLLTMGEKITDVIKAKEVAIKTIAKEVGSFDREVLFSLNLTTQNEVINASMIHMGTINSSVAHPREIFKASILSNAARVILFHNHPSGKLEPSPADINFTKRIIQTGEILGIEVLDHFIVNQFGEYLSIVDEQYLSRASEILEAKTLWKDIEEERATYTKQLDEINLSNLEKFKVLSRRKDNLKQERLNLEYEAISGYSTKNIDREIQKIDEVINTLLSPKQKEHIVEFLKTKTEESAVTQEETIYDWTEIYFGEKPLFTKMIDEGLYRKNLRAWTDFLIQEFEKGNISWDSLVNAGYDTEKTIDEYRNSSKNIDNQPIYRKVIAVEKESNFDVIFEIKKYDLPKVYLTDSSGNKLKEFDIWDYDFSFPLQYYANYFFSTKEPNYSLILETLQEAYSDYTFNLDPEVILSRNLSIENVILPTGQDNLVIEESKKGYVRKTSEEKKAELERLAKQIQEKVNEFTENPKLIKDFLLFKRQFYNYSTNNNFLIYSQKPNALGVGSYKFWEKQGYQVKKGEKAIMLFAPVLSDTIIDSTGKFVNTVKNASPEELHKLEIGQYSKRTVNTGFRKVSAFDISQTTAPLEKYPERIRQHYELNHLKEYRVQNMAVNRLAKEAGIQFIDYDKARVGKSTLGYYIPSERGIYLQPDLAPIARFKVAVHELAHGFLHNGGNNLSKDEKEFQAQMTALIVSDTLGLPTKDSDYGYVKNYQKDLSEERKRELLEGVLSVSDKVLDSFERTLERVKSNQLTNEEMLEVERLQLMLPALTTIDLQEVIYYPATLQQKYFLATKLVEKNVKEMTADERKNYYEEQLGFIRNKVQENHQHFQIGLLDEAVLSKTPENKLELQIVSIDGKETKQVFDEEEQVVELLVKKEAVPVPENAVSYSKNRLEVQNSREKQLEKTQQQIREQQI